jgi:hypothetical protein
MKRNFSKPGSREKIDKIEKKATMPDVSRKEKSIKRKLSIYDEFDDDEMDDIDQKLLRYKR